MGKTEYELERAISVEGRASLSVRGEAGDVHIRAWEDSVIQIRAEGGEPNISATLSSVAVHPGPNNGAIDYEIRVPKTCSIEVRQSAGDVTVEGTTGELNVQSHEGDVTLVSVEGACTVRTASGDVEAEGLRGLFVANTASGDVTVERSALSGFSVETVSGEAEIETSLTREGSYRFKTVSGDLQLAIPRDAGASIRLQTQQGDVECDLPAQVTQASRTRWEGTINGGGARIEMQSVTGDLEIEGRGDLPAPARYESPALPRYESSVPALPAPEPEDAAPASSTESASILEMLARGEIDVDEAMAELDRIEA